MGLKLHSHPIIWMTLCSIILLISIATTFAFTTTPVIKFSGPLYEVSNYESVGLATHLFKYGPDEMNGDVFDIRIGSLTAIQRDSFNQMIVESIDLYTMGLQNTFCFWVGSDITTGVPIWSQFHVPPAMKTTSSQFGVFNSPTTTQFGVFYFPTTTQDLSNSILSLRCHIMTDEDGRPNSAFFPDTKVTIKFILHNDETITHTDLLIDDKDITLPPIRPIRFSTSLTPDYNNNIGQIIKSVQTSGEHGIDITFNLPKTRIPNRGDSLYVRFYSSHKSFFLGTCTFSTNYEGSTYEFVWDDETDEDLMIIFHFVYYPRTTIAAGEYSGTVSCQLEVYEDVLDRFSSDVLEQTAEFYTYYLRSCSYFQANCADGTDLSILSDYVLPTPFTGRPMFVGTSTPTQSPESIIAHFRSPRCGPSDPDDGFQCIQDISVSGLPTNGDNVRVFVGIYDYYIDDISQVIEIGTTTIDWSKYYQTITINYDLTFPTGYPTRYYIQNDYGERFLVATRTTVRSRVWFVANCAKVTIDRTVFSIDSDDTICTTNGTTCDQHYGVCTCTDTNRFNPSLRLPSDDMCTATSCDGVIECKNDSTPIRNDYGQCVCQCTDTTNPWRDCRDDTSEAINIHAGFIKGPYYMLLRNARRFDNGFDYSFELNFGTVESFYNANLHHAEYFAAQIGYNYTITEYVSIEVEQLSTSLISKYECYFAMKDVDDWYNPMNPIGLEITWKLFERIDTTISSDVNKMYQESFEESSTPILINPLYNRPKPSKDDLQLQIGILCRTYFDDEDDFPSTRNVTVTAVGKNFQKQIPTTDLTIPAGMFNWGPTAILLTNYTDSPARVQLDPNNVGLHLMFDVEFESPPATGEYGNSYFSSFVSHQYQSCHLNQHDNDGYGENEWDGFSYIDLGPNNFYENVATNMTCRIYLDGSNTDATTSEEYFNLLKDDGVNYELDLDGGDVEFDINETKSVTYDHFIAYGEKLFFAIPDDDFYEYSYFNMSSLHTIEMHYPTSTNLAPVTIGYSSTVSVGFQSRQNWIQVTVSSKELQYFKPTTTSGNVTFTLHFIEERDDGLQSIEVRLLSHFNPIIYPYCAKWIRGGFYGTDEINLEVNCPGTSTCNLTTNQCTMADNSVVCTDLSKPILLNGVECIPKCADNQLYNPKSKLCVSNCNNNSQQHWVDAVSKCVDYCEDVEIQWWNGYGCTRPCASDEIITISNNRQQCKSRCTVSQYWDEEKQLCRDRCLGGLLYNTDSKSCISSSTCNGTNKYWTGLTCLTCTDEQYFDNTQCVTRCTNPKQDWNGTSCVDRCASKQDWDGTTCIDRCSNSKQDWDGTKCIDRCTNPKQDWNGTECVNRCTSEQDWDGTVCVCNDVSQKIENGVCVSKCTSTQTWNSTTLQCDENTSNNCKEGDETCDCGQDLEWDGKQCVTKQSKTNPNTSFTTMFSQIIIALCFITLLF